MSLQASGGLCAPISEAYAIQRSRPDIWPNRIQLLSRLRRFFSWDEDWGLHLRGGPPPKLRDLFPVMRAERGGITYTR